MIERIQVNKITCDCCGGSITQLDDGALADRMKHRLMAKKPINDWSMSCGHHVCYQCVDHINKKVCPICDPDGYNQFWCLKHWVITPGKDKCNYSKDRDGTKRGYKECKIVSYYEIARRV